MNETPTAQHFGGNMTHERRCQHTPSVSSTIRVSVQHTLWSVKHTPSVYSTPRECVPAGAETTNRNLNKKHPRSRSHKSKPEIETKPIETGIER